MKLFNGLQLPIDTGEENPDNGWVKLVSRNGELYIKKFDGTLNRVFQNGDPTVFIQPDQPVYQGKYIWIQTNINNNPNSFSIWFEDGIL